MYSNVPMSVAQELEAADGKDREAAYYRRRAKSTLEHAKQLEAQAVEMRREVMKKWKRQRREIIVQERLGGRTWKSVAGVAMLNAAECRREYKRYQRQHWKRLEDPRVAAYLYKCLDGLSLKNRENYLLTP
jgi:hypothetical protein